MEPAIVGNDGVAAADAEGLGSDLDPRRSLAALVLGTIDEFDHSDDDITIDPLGNQFLNRQVALDVSLDHTIEILVGRQAVLILLVGTKLRRWRLVDDRFGDGILMIRNRGG